MLTLPKSAMMSAELQKWHFNVEQYYRLAEAGVLKPDDRVELIEGEIFRTSPIGSAHAACRRGLAIAFSELFGRRYLVSIQSPVHLDDFSERSLILLSLNRARPYTPIGIRNRETCC